MSENEGGRFLEENSVTLSVECRDYDWRLNEG
jgi:hypothetical protein